MYRFQFRRDTKANWLNADPIPLEGELCYETDTRHAKVGDGINRYSKLEYSYIVNNISQEMGGSTTLTMSQKAITGALNAAITGINGKIQTTDDNSFSVCDSNGNVAIRYSNEGLDAAKVTNHLASLIKKIIGVEGGGSSSGGGSSVSSLLEQREVEENGLYFVDADMNVVASINDKGLHSINIIEYVND